MWELEYSDEAKFYFIDNDPLAFDLLVKIEELKYAPDGVPAEGCTPVESGLFVWEVLQHLVYFRRRGTTLTVAVVKPIE